MQRIVNGSDPLLFHYSAIAYKPFLSLFNMTGIIETNQLPSALGTYPKPSIHRTHTDQPKHSKLRLCDRIRAPSTRRQLRTRYPSAIQDAPRSALTELILTCCLNLMLIRAYIRQCYSALNSDNT